MQNPLKISPRYGPVLSTQGTACLSTFPPIGRGYGCLLTDESVQQHVGMTLILHYTGTHGLRWREREREKERSFGGGLSGVTTWDRDEKMFPISTHRLSHYGCLTTQQERLSHHVPLYGLYIKI
jgi:hypothetical protein